MAPEAQDLTPAQLAELSALADGSLDPARREAVEAWIASSPKLRDLYQRERAAVRVLHRLTTDPAPARLRLRVEAERVRRARSPHARRPRVRLGYGAVAGALAAAAIVAALLVLPGGAPGSPSVSQAAALALRGPASGPPAADSALPRVRLAAQLGQLYFPNWSTTLGWRAVGMRRDRLDGRNTMTVYYRRRGALVAYTIVGTPALGSRSGHITWLNGYRLRTFSLGRRTVVTWRRAGYTCVLSAVRVPARALQQLAGWRGSGLSD